MENEKLRNFLRLVISNLQLESIKVEISHPSAQFSDPQRQGMVTAYTDGSTALTEILDESPIQPSLMELFDKWFDLLNRYEERSDASFEMGYKHALRRSIGTMEYLLDE
jgi:hypothetical protein